MHLIIVQFSSKWVPGGAGDVPHQGRRFIHPDGPQLGSYWNSQSCVAFDKLKLTNNRQDQRWDLVIMIELLSWLLLLQLLYFDERFLCIQCIVTNPSSTSNQLLQRPAVQYWKMI